MSESPEAVAFHTGEYAGMPRRMAAAFIDFVVIILLLAAFATVANLAVVPPEVRRLEESPGKQKQVSEYLKPVGTPVTLGWLAACVVYHVALRRMRGGTIGYRLTRQRLVDASGQPPAGRVLIRRFLLGTPFVLFFGLAYLPCRRSPRRQALHDQWSGTWVVRARATPSGPARIIYLTKLFGMKPLIYPDLEPITDPSAQESAAAVHTAAEEPN